jgi:molecular chaperone GrpE
MILFNDSEDKNLQDVPEASTEEVVELESDDQEIEDKFDCLNCKDLPELKDSYLRLNADFENYKKRVQKDQVNWVAAGQAKVLFDLLEIVDNFDRALAEHEHEGHSESLDSWLQGFEMIRKSFYKYLESNGVKKIEQIETFDPTLHEAISQVDAEGKATDSIVDVVQQGYMFNDNVLRPAKVVVAK